MSNHVYRFATNQADLSEEYLRLIDSAVDYIDRLSLRTSVFERSQLPPIGELLTALEIAVSIDLPIETRMPVRYGNVELEKLRAGELDIVTYAN